MSAIDTALLVLVWTVVAVMLAGGAYVAIARMRNKGGKS